MLLLLLGEVVKFGMLMLMWLKVALAVVVFVEGVVAVVVVVVTEDVTELELTITTLDEDDWCDLESVLFLALCIKPSANSGNGKCIGLLGPYSCNADE